VVVQTPIARTLDAVNLDVAMEGVGPDWGMSELDRSERRAPRNEVPLRSLWRGSASL